MTNRCFIKEGIYNQHLTQIGNTKLTMREIDIISCILHNRTNKKIASILSISNRTVETHIYNVLSKLNKCSKDDIIDFIEKFGKPKYIREYYISLLIRNLFEKYLVKICSINKSKLIYSVNDSSIEQDDKKSSTVLFQLEEDLKLANIFRDDKVKLLTFHIATNIKDIEEHNDITLLFGSKNSEVLDSKKIIDFTNNQDYYLAAFELLKKITNIPVVDTLAKEFQEEYNLSIHHCGNNEILSDTKNDDIPGNTKIPVVSILRNHYYLIIFIVNFIIAIGSVITVWNFFFKNNSPSPILTNSETNDSSVLKTAIVKSDFKIPSILLDRSELINKIEQRLETNKGISTVALIAVVGIGGAGKTVLARQFAKLCKFQIVWELNAEKKDSLLNSFLDLAHALAKSNKQKKELESVKAIKDIKHKENQLLSLVKSWLKEGESWLLIYDNVENISDIRDYLPQNPEMWGCGKVIITTRDTNIQSTEYITAENVVQIDELCDSEKLELFGRIFYNILPEKLTVDQKLQAVNFLKNIPPFPLDISAAAYYLKITGASFKKYLEKLNANDSDFERIQSVLLKDIGGYTKTRYNIITMSLKKLIYMNSDFRDLILLISLLDSQNIPRELLSRYKNDTITDELIFNLKKYSLITIGASSALGSFFSIHRSVQAIILAYLTQNLNLEENKNQLESIACILEEYIGYLLDNEDTAKMVLVTSHYEAFLGHKNILNEDIEAYIEASLGSIYHYTSYNTIRAVQVFEGSLKKLRQRSNKDILKARTMTLLADLYRKLGNYDNVESLLQEACKIYTKNRKRTVNEAYTLGSFGLFYQSIGNYKKAEELLNRSIAIYSTYPQNSIGMARILAYQGLTYADLGYYNKAISFMKKSQEIYHNQPELHFRLRWVLMYIGDIYRKLGDYKNAKQFLEESLALYKNSVKSLDKYRALSYLGIVYSELGDYEKAKMYLNESSEFYQEYYPNSFDRVWTMSHLSEFYRKLGNYQKAQALLEDTLIIYNNKNNTVDNIRSAWLLARLGCIHNDLGNYMEAWKLITRSLNIYKKHFGEHNIKTAKILFHLGEVYECLRNSEESIKIFEGCLIQYKENYGDNHLKTAQLMNSLANSYIMNNDFVKAEELIGKTLKIFKSYEHSDQYMSLESFGNLYKKMAIEYAKNGDYNQSKIFNDRVIGNFKNALEILKTSIQEEGSSHIIELETKLKEAIECYK